MGTDSNIIFYGITGYLKRNLEQYISLAGEPKLIADKDEKVLEYRGKKLYDKYPVCTLDFALGMFPDAQVWVVYRNPGKTAGMLATKVDPSRIHFFESDLEYRKGCKYLGHFVSYRKDSFSPCCVTKQCPVVKTDGPIPKRMHEWTEYTTKLIDDIREGRPNPCMHCPQLREGFYHKEVKLNTVSFGSNQPGDVCNFNCTYCFSKKQLARLKNETDGYSAYEIIKQLSTMPEYDNPDLKIILSNGEFCVNEHCDEILDILLAGKWKATFVTNCSVYREKFNEFLKTGRAVRVLISLDAGTRDTFKAIKGNDAFDRVVENLKRYDFGDTEFILKYIFLEGVNDNDKDIDGFLDIAKESGCKILWLSSDLFKPFTPLMRELATRLIKNAKEAGIEVRNQSSYLCKEDAEFIKNMASKAEI